jgi:hypothetical protein
MLQIGSPARSMRRSPRSRGAPARPATRAGPGDAAKHRRDSTPTRSTRPWNRPLHHTLQREHEA